MPLPLPPMGLGAPGGNRGPAILGRGPPPRGCPIPLGAPLPRGLIPLIMPPLTRGPVPRGGRMRGWTPEKNNHKNIGNFLCKQNICIYFN